MSKVFVVIENEGGYDEVVKIFKNSKKAEKFAEDHKDLRYADGHDVDVCVVEMEVK
jgi:hypothetical protein